MHMHEDECLGERRLIAAVLTKALDDLEKSLRKFRRTVGPKDALHHAMNFSDAGIWLTRPEHHGPMSAPWCCEVLGLDYDGLIKALATNWREILGSANKQARQPETRASRVER